MRIVNTKLPKAIKDDFNVGIEQFVIWCGLLQFGKYLPSLRRSRVIRGYIVDGKKKIYFCRYGLINDPAIWK